MTRNIWFTSDQHYGHENILKFKNKFGNLIRGDKIKNIDDHDEMIIENHNSLVKDGDYVYNLGDFAWSPQIAQKILPKLNGSHRLVVGNHDNIKKISPLFKKVHLWRIFREYGFICSHLPLTPQTIPDSVVVNVHGHLHQNQLFEDQYLNVCLEMQEYKPIHLDDIIGYVNWLKRILNG